MKQIREQQQQDATFADDNDRSRKQSVSKPPTLQSSTLEKSTGGKSKGTEAAPPQEWQEPNKEVVLQLPASLSRRSTPKAGAKGITTETSVPTANAAVAAVSPVRGETTKASKSPAVVVLAASAASAKREGTCSPPPTRELSLNLSSSGVSRELSRGTSASSFGSSVSRDTGPSVPIAHVTASTSVLNDTYPSKSSAAAMTGRAKKRRGSVVVISKEEKAGFGLIVNEKEDANPAVAVPSAQCNSRSDIPASSSSAGAVAVISTGVPAVAVEPVAAAAPAAGGRGGRGVPGMVLRSGSKPATYSAARCTDPIEVAAAAAAALVAQYPESRFAPHPAEPAVVSTKTRSTHPQLSVQHQEQQHSGAAHEQSLSSTFDDNPGKSPLHHTDHRTEHDDEASPKQQQLVMPPAVPRLHLTSIGNAPATHSSGHPHCLPNVPKENHQNRSTAPADIADKSLDVKIPASGGGGDYSGGVTEVGFVSAAIGSNGKANSPPGAAVLQMSTSVGNAMDGCRTGFPDSGNGIAIGSELSRDGYTGTFGPNEPRSRGPSTSALEDTGNSTASSPCTAAVGMGTPPPLPLPFVPSSKSAATVTAGGCGGGGGGGGNLALASNTSGSMSSHSPELNSSGASTMYVSPPGGGSCGAKTPRSLASATPRTPHTAHTPRTLQETYTEFWDRAFKLFSYVCCPYRHVAEALSVMEGK